MRSAAHPQATTATTSARVRVSITAVVNSSGTLRAYYRYDPFGRQRAQGGALSAANVMRFSSKPWVAFNANISDGLYYYGYRFYDPYLQRWLNRDPTEAEGGTNIYAFLDGDPLNDINPDGLQADSVSKAACRPDSAGRIAREYLLDVLKARQRQMIEDAATKAAEQAAKVLKRKIEKAERLFRTDRDFRDWVHREVKKRLPKSADGSSKSKSDPRGAGGGDGVLFGM